MKISKAILKAWKNNLLNVPKSEISQNTGLTEKSIYNAFKGTCQRRTMDAINAYILRRKADQKKMLKQLK